MSGEVEGCVVSSEDEEEGWVPLENTFTSQERGEGGESEEPDGEGPVFAVSRGASDAQITVTFVGSLDGGEEESQLTEEISFERLSALHRCVCHVTAMWCAFAHNTLPLSLGK